MHLPFRPPAGTRSTAHSPFAGGTATGAPVRDVRDRDVLLPGAFVIAVVLGLQALGILVPGFQEALDVVPAVIVGLVLVTLAILARTAIVTFRTRQDPR
jgi:hypothetical protein